MHSEPVALRQSLTALRGRQPAKPKTNLRLGHDRKRSHRKRAELTNLYRNSKKLEAIVRKITQATKMFDNRNIVAKKNRMRRTSTCLGIVDVV